MFKVLLVEDEIGERIARRLRRKFDYDVTVATTGEEGVRLAEEIAPDVILMDNKLSLSEMGGVEATDAIKANPGTANTPVIMLTANVMAGERRDAAIRCDDFLEKPIDFDLLHECVQKCVLESNRKSSQ